MRTLALAHTIEGDSDLDSDEVETLAIQVLEACFDDFDPRRGDPKISVENRFVRRFRYVFKRSLATFAKDRAGRERRKAERRYAERKRLWEPRDEAVAEWGPKLLGGVLPRLSKQARDFVRYHLLEELTLDETARRMGLPRGRLRPYERGGILRIIREEVGVMVREMGADEIEPMVYAMHVVQELERDTMARLLCVSPAEVDEMVGWVKNLSTEGTAA